jgi:5'-nucleotidase (lipoprotein e(P4) family)
MNGTSRYLCIVVVFAALWSSDCQEGDDDTPRDVWWVRSSIEYQLLCHQTYRNAWEYVKSRTRSFRRDWVVILDVDMTVLDNSDFQEKLRGEKRRFPYGWEEYVRKADSPPVPGAVAFVDSVRSLGDHAHIVYNTDRAETYEEPTRENLKRVGLWKEGDLLMCRQSGKDPPDTKAIRRNEIMRGIGRCDGMGERVIVAFIGDELEDLSDRPSELSLDELKQFYSLPENRGENCFIVPNPMYGNWMGGYR